MIRNRRPTHLRFTFRTASRRPPTLRGAPREGCVQLSRLLSVLDQYQIINQSDPEISGLAHDSRRVNPGDCFVCVVGYKTDGHQFAAQALARGASAFVVEQPLEAGPEVVQIKVPNARRALALLAAQFHGQPGRRLNVIGVTGTNGKTTTTYLIESILAGAGWNPGLIGTMEIRQGEMSRIPLTTTPDALELQQTLAEMAAAGAQGAVMEVSSHALALDRVLGIPFRLGIFTNLTQDHLDFHADLEDYFQAKLQLFTGLEADARFPGRVMAIINLDDPCAQRILQAIRVPALTYGLGEEAAVRAVDLRLGADGARFTVEFPQGSQPLNLALAGRFNVYNALAAFSAGLALELPLEIIAGEIEKVRGVRGRFQRIDEGQPFTVVVDYGHTPDGLANILTGVRELTRGRVLAVFGCGGDRDRKKRPLMGETAGRLADLVIITSDNPRTEDPESIIAEIEPGVKQTGCEYLVEADRRSAILLAMSRAGSGDAVVIAGKGHEDYQIIGTRKVHFDDVEEAREALREISRRPAGKELEPGWNL